MIAQRRHGLGGTGSAGGDLQTTHSLTKSLAMDPQRIGRHTWQNGKISIWLHSAPARHLPRPHLRV